MNICIIVFSPSGHTLKAAQMMKAAMEKEMMQVQLINITGQKEVFKNNNLRGYLVENINAHDVLCVGGPVYAGHLEGNVRKVIKTLPKPDGHWGKLAIPFITYGGLHSSVSLQEAGALLHACGRINILGVKMESFHSLSQTLPCKINEGKPGLQEEAVAQEMAHRLKQMSHIGDWKDVRKSFGYASLLHKVVLKFLDQDYFHSKYRTVRANPEVCNGCGVCKKVCPVNLIEIIEQKAVRVENADNYCLLCAECYHHCPRKAVVHEFLEQKISKRLSAEQKRYHETPRSTVYPVDSQ